VLRYLIFKYTEQTGIDAIQNSDSIAHGPAVAKALISLCGKLPQCLAWCHFSI